MKPCQPAPTGPRLAHGNPDGDTHFDLEGHERLNSRLLIGITF